jgi:uncharacterized membrane protein YjdF
LKPRKNKTNKKAEHIYISIFFCIFILFISAYPAEEHLVFVVEEIPVFIQLQAVATTAPREFFSTALITAVISPATSVF